MRINAGNIFVLILEGNQRWDGVIKDFVRKLWLGGIYEGFLKEIRVGIDLVMTP